MVKLGVGSWELGARSWELGVGSWELDWDRERELGWDLEPRGRNPRKFRLGGPKSALGPNGTVTIGYDGFTKGI